MCSACQAERGRDTASPLTRVSVTSGQKVYVHSLGQRRATAHLAGVGFIFYFLNTRCAQTRRKPSREERAREERRGARRQGGRGKPSLEATGVLHRLRVSERHTFRHHLCATDEPQERARARYDVVEMVEETGRSRPLIDCGRHLTLKSELRVARLGRKASLPRFPCLCVLEISRPCSTAAACSDQNPVTGRFSLARTDVGVVTSVVPSISIGRNGPANQVQTGAQRCSRD